MKQKQKLEELESDLVTKGSEIEQKDEALNELHDLVAQKTRVLESREAEVAQMKVRTQQLETQFNEKSQVADGLEGQIAKLKTDSQHAQADHQATVRNLNTEIQSLREGKRATEADVVAVTTAKKAAETSLVIEKKAKETTML